ncbi:MAG: hypothetical protein IJ231_10310 [Clostridia bacterium]|nr:hypothetical protein [Clostridia bacterium]
MIKLLCSTPFETVELEPGVAFRPFVPIYAIKNGGDEEALIVIDGETSVKAAPGWTINKSGETDITIFNEGNSSYSFSIRPGVEIVSLKSGLTYEEFYEQYEANKEDPLKAVLEREILIYALPEPEMKDDISIILAKIKEAYPHFKAICSKARSHLKSINEIRPIETVKRIGHESIPYLAAHSEDWLARTASGLKPSRLYSRVEEDDYQIYENRVIKTMIDDVLTYLRRKSREMNNLEEQLDQILDSNVNMDSSGFDVSHQICISKILGKDSYESFNNEAKKRERTEEQLTQIRRLQRLFEELKRSRLYKSNYKSRRVRGALLQTNILLMDKHYHQASMLWKPLRDALVREDTELKERISDNHLSAEEAQDSYNQYCAVMCSFALDSLGFHRSSANEYDRQDDVRISVKNEGESIIIDFIDNRMNSLLTDTEIVSPIQQGESFGPFSYDGEKIIWRQRLDEKTIQGFSDLHRHKKSTGAEKKKELQNKQALYDKLVELNKQTVRESHRILLFPSFCELSDVNDVEYRTQMQKEMQKLCKIKKAEKGFVLMPLYEKNQREITEYAFFQDEKIGLFPVSMYDINSYRRLRNIFLRYITQVTVKHCPCCGEQLYKSKDGDNCRSCGNIYVRREKCKVCHRDYSYIWSDISEKAIHEIASLEKENNHARFDSRFQYRNIMPMIISEDNKILALCPWHHDAPSQASKQE